MTMQENTLHLETIRVDRPRPGILLATLHRPGRPDPTTRPPLRAPGRCAAPPAIHPLHRRPPNPATSRPLASPRDRDNPPV